MPSSLFDKVEAANAKRREAMGPIGTGEGQITEGKARSSAEEAGALYMEVAMLTLA